jgi:hypothetical protein
MFCDQLTQFFNLLSDQGFKIKDIPFAEEWTEGFTTPSMDIMMRSRAYATWNSQGPQLVVILVSAGHCRRIYGVEETDIVDVNFVWSNTDDWA